METEEKGNKKKGKYVIIVLLLLCIAVLAFVCYKLYTNKEEPVDDDDGNGSAMIVTEDTRDAFGKINEKVEKGKISVRMTRGWVFEDGGKKSNAYLANSKRNSYDLKFEITLEDTGEVIMESPAVAVGSCIENFPLSKTLEPGEYNVVIAHQQLEDGEVINTVRTRDTITVK